MHFINKIAGAHVKNLHFLNPVYSNQQDWTEKLFVRMIPRLISNTQSIVNNGEIKTGGILFGHFSPKIKVVSRAESNQYWWRCFD